MERAPELHVSALSPAEFRAYKRYLDLLALAQARDGVAALGADGSVRFERAAIRHFAEERLGARAVDEVLARVTTGARLSAGQVYAVFRLLAHQAAGKRAAVDLVFVPVEPLPSTPMCPCAINSSSRGPRPSLPPRRTPSPRPPPRRPARKSLPNALEPNSLDPFRDGSPGPTPAKARTYSTPALGTVGAVGSNNPFLTTAPQLDSGKPLAQSLIADCAPSPLKQDTSQADSTSEPPLRSIGPPLPPRKPSVRRPGPALPPRSRVRADSLSSSENQPTSNRESSSIMQQSFAAAANREQPRRITTMQVLRSSDRRVPPPRPDDAQDIQPRPRRDDSAGSNSRRDLVDQVNRAIRESEVDPPPPPPQRVVSASRPKPTPSPLSAAAAFTKAAEEARAKHPGLKTWPHVGLLSDRPSRQAFAMIILNQPITRHDTLMRVWHASTLRYCADGGANRLYDALDPDERERMLPTMIKGDLDSIRPEVKAFYASRGVAIKRDASEYATDLQKNIDEVEAIEKVSGKTFSLVFLGGLSGRLDQTMHVLSTLFKMRETRRCTYVISEESLAWVLDTGVHLIEVDHASMGQTCGILPVGVSEAYVRTEGLKWNLDWVTSVMGDLSSSNHLLEDENTVLIDTSAPIVWTVEIRNNLQIQPLRSPTGVDELSRGVKELGRAVGKGMGSIGQGINRRISRQGVPVSNEDEGQRGHYERAALVQQDSGYASHDGEADGYAQLD
ncbi:hypothetical protein CspeluHIS016_0701810 [Cutaneotrichosporon spelunceum]|uniref:Thiamin pyrophosphokinase thiamin-binding domain-containing protein n=1 Tax=Cutaneotrichosporon spelunceum TaxID=1672016 RepID=A0AAD3YDJ0_9TREE|nr:hypothetical protein CspeluHIS016_0701810 [Cutaneotrichosporon spelunceum]